MAVTAGESCAVLRGKLPTLHVLPPSLPQQISLNACHRGHASSIDLLEWKFHPAALLAGEGHGDDGIFSGCAIVTKEGVPALVYHGVGAGTCVAFADDPDDEYLISWSKHASNPVIAESRALEGVFNVFDPHCWLDDDGETYNMILGGRVKPYDIGDTAYLFRSTDLLNWEYCRPFYHPKTNSTPGSFVGGALDGAGFGGDTGAWTGAEEDCACPDFFELDGRHMLLCISHPRGCRYYLGRLQRDTPNAAPTFVPEEHHRMNFPGGLMFAPESLLDDRKRRIFWSWLLDGRVSQRSELGVMTAPRVLSLDPHDGQLLIEPPAEFASLRAAQKLSVHDLTLAAGELMIADVQGDVLELLLECSDLPIQGRFSVLVRASPAALGSGTGTMEQTVITIDLAAGTLSVDTTRSRATFTPPPVTDPSAPKTDPDEMRVMFPVMGQSPAPVETPVQIAPFSLKFGEALALRVFIDKSVLEVFANVRFPRSHLMKTERN
jgi:sucrose-6-phosphate hydrolase SacC (GH32 family)